MSITDIDSSDLTARQVATGATVTLPRGHIPALDAVRGLAILMVTLYRFRQGPTDSTMLGQVLFPMLNVGSRGVDLFFVLSGFLITGILYDAKTQSHYFRNFYARRVLRIFPLYYGVLFAAFFLLPWVWSGPSPFAKPQAVQGWLWTYCANVLMTIRGEWCLGDFDHFWSLAVEEHFYLLWPLVVYSCSRKTTLRVCVVLILASTLGRVSWVLLGGNAPAAAVFTLFRMDALLIGAWVALVARGEGGMEKLTRYLYPAAGLSFLLLLPAVVVYRRLMTIPDTLCAVFFATLILIAITVRPTSLSGRFWNARALRFLGKYSYAMYVFQLPLIPLLAVFFTAESLTGQLGSPFWGRIAYIVLMFAATLLAAIVSWHLFEKHFLKLKRYFTAESVAA